MRRGASWLLGGLLAVFLGALAWSGGRLPGNVPMHWDVTGAPDRWASRTAAVLTMLVIVVGYTVLFIVLGLVMGRPRSELTMLNVPNKQAWLTPEHRDSARARARSDIWLLGVPMMPTFIAMPFATLQAAGRPGHALPGWLWAVLAISLAGLIGVTIMIVLGWRRGPTS